MPHDFQQWDLRVQRTAQRLVGDEILRLQKSLVFLALGAAVEVSPGNIRKILGVVLRTPVLTGRARAAWNVSVGTPDSRVPAPIRGRRSNVQALTDTDARTALRTLGPYDIVWITNGLPYIRVLEYGLYPSSPKLGTFVRGRRGKQGHFEVRSAGGYSKQAPRGMVRITFDELLEILRSTA